VGLARTTAALAVASAVLLSANAAGQAPPGSSVTPAQATALGRQAFLYGYPLLEVLRVRATATSVACPDHAGNAPVNSLSSARKFADPTERTIVAPNVDTLYSIAQLDLGRGPVVLSHPAMGHRFFDFELVDPYTNVVGYVGTRTTGSKAGRFEIVWSGKPGARVAGAKRIVVPYRRIWLIGRTLTSGGRDRPRAIALMKRYSLSQPGGPRKFRPGCRPGKPHGAKTPGGLAFLDALGKALVSNPPPAADQPQLEQLKSIGVGPGLRPQDAGLSADALKALADSVNATAKALPQITQSTILAQAAAHEGWATPPAEIGAYGTDYLTRAAIAWAGLGANTQIEAMYPTAYFDKAGATLVGSHRYRLVFPAGQQPPARAFWSVTMYDRAGYLVRNPAHRYAIGSSHPPLYRRADGSIVILIQHDRPHGSRVNWLPAPAGRAFRVNLRLYSPRASALDGTWRPPGIERVG
jgi:hypothetical protein